MGLGPLCAAALVSALGGSGCFSELPLPTCRSDADCAARGDGRCTCHDGYCFSWGRGAGGTCEATAPDVAPPDDGGGAEDGTPPAGCTAQTPAQSGDACCPPALQDLASDPECAGPPASLALPGPAVAVVATGDGVLGVSTSNGAAAGLTLVSAQLSGLGSVAAGAAASEVLGPVALPDGRLAWTEGGTLVALDPEDLAAGAMDLGLPPLASAPVVLADGTLLASGEGGELVYGPPRSQVSSPLLPAGQRYRLALAPDERWLFAVDDAGTLWIVDPNSGKQVFEHGGAAASAPAPPGADQVVVARADGTLDGAIRSAGAWIALPPVAAGDGPTDPVVAEGGLILVASTASKRLTAIAVSGQTPVVRWTLEDLTEPAAAAPLILSDGTAALPLAGGRLQGLGPIGPGAAPAPTWQLSLTTAALLHPRELAPGTVLYLAVDGTAALVHRPAGAASHPWPTLGGRPSGSGRGEP